MQLPAGTVDIGGLLLHLGSGIAREAGVGLACPDTPVLLVVILLKLLILLQRLV